MKKLIIENKNRDLQVLNYSVSKEGTYRVITKCKAGFMVSSDVQAKSAISAFRQYKPKAIQSIAFVMESGSTITVFARSGKKVWASECFLSEVTVGDINQELFNTALYNQYQYESVNAKTWADKAYVINKEAVAA